jgi:curved DNA-binding protein CbpA
VSPKADQETIRRMYRLQAQRFHPDNLDTGDAEKFRLVAEAYENLGDPQRRAAYDAGYRPPPPPPPPEPESSAPDPIQEATRRDELLMQLYRKRLISPDSPSLGLRELESLMGTPRERLEFSIWYLKECGYLTRTDSGRHTITIKGVQQAESIARAVKGA